MMMEFIDVPQQFAPAFGPAVYTMLGQADGNLIDVIVRNDDTNEILGAKRFIDSGEMTVNVAVYLRRCLDPVPVEGDGFGFIVPTGRSVRASVEVGELVSESRLFTAAVENLPGNGGMDCMPRNRTLAFDEWDEIAFRVDRQARCVVQAISEAGPFEIGTFEWEGGPCVCLFRVNGWKIAEILQTSECSLESYRQLIIDLTIDGKPISFSYGLHKPVPGSFRLGWLNRYGGIDYYSFPPLNTERVAAEKQRYLGPTGYRTSGTAEERRYVLDSGYLPEAVLRALSGVVGSPRVWRIRENGPSDVDVLTESMTVRSPEMNRLVLEVRESNVVNLQTF